MNKKSLAKTLLILSGASLLFGCGSAKNKSLTVKCSNKRADLYSSKYTFLGNIEELKLEEREIEGEIFVSFTYGA